MEKDVAIIEKNTGKIIEIYTIEHVILNGTTKDEGFYDEAWESALEDNKISENSNRLDYDFEFIGVGKVCY